ncbi:hypothetical protein BU14_0527s0008 [Porphyra umbilicalis]|uniref:Uncharacterized protein n=1 Tax=Porphyra umbilicalis TaxID=2786 RepID=A0A1X6NSE3_PORUM|nr:hypothetical protein BU14_0527s0008 [Porphyra umbilicalis]|eukprot:OSX71495.1 hypothetical protein BU14_0527s0008 [Porphyra umbilicalis]
MFSTHLYERRRGGSGDGGGGGAAARVPAPAADAFTLETAGVNVSLAHLTYRVPPPPTPFPRPGPAAGTPSAFRSAPRIYAAGPNLRAGMDVADSRRPLARPRGRAPQTAADAGRGLNGRPRRGAAGDGRTGRQRVGGGRPAAAGGRVQGGGVCRGRAARGGTAAARRSVRPLGGVPVTRGEKPNKPAASVSADSARTA